MCKNPWVIVMGYSGSGKSAMSKILRQKGIISFEFSDYFRILLKLEDTPRQEMLKRIEEHIRSKGRTSVVMDIILWARGQIHPTYGGPIFLIGARHSEDIKILKRSLPVIFCVLIQASEEIRANRIIHRGRAIDKIIIDDLISKCSKKVDPELTNCIREHVNYVIENSGEFADLEYQINVLLSILERYNETS